MIVPPEMSEEIRFKKSRVTIDTLQTPFENAKCLKDQKISSEKMSLSLEPLKKTTGLPMNHLEMMRTSLETRVRDPNLKKS